MSVKILGGALKGFEISMPQNETTRPTAVLLRRKIFDRYQDLTGFSFIDLCAGSGAMGLEALSRGAEEVTLVEKDARMIRNLKETMARLGKRSGAQDLMNRVQVVQGEANKWLVQNLKSDNLGRVIVFFDPPYDDIKLYKDILERMPLLFKSFMLWIEYDEKQAAVSELLEKFSSQEVKRYEHSGHHLLVLKFGQDA
jgi:16S rRNA (guanine966-N2)-methyltransferase